MLRCADLFLLPSETESFGLAALEAMACGVPAVSSDVGGVAEVVGETGRLVPVREPEAMARAAIDILGDADLHRKLADAARARACDEFTTDRVVARYESVYERALA